MSVIRAAAATGDLAQSTVALEDPLLQRAPLAVEDRLPRLDELRGDPREAFPGGNPPPCCLAGGAERRRHESGGLPGRPDVEFAPRAHLRFFEFRQFPPERDAGHLGGPRDPFVDGLLVGVPGDEPRLLVRYAP